MLSRIRYNIGKIVPERVQDFIGRHFTWLSGTLLGFSIAVDLILVLLYVPGATANAVIRLALSAGAGIMTMVSFVGGLLTIGDYCGINLKDASANSKKSVSEELSSPVQGFVKTEKERLEEAMRELEGWFTIHSDGQIEFRNEGTQKKGDRKAMLYVFAARVAYEADKRETPKMSKEEIKDLTGFSTKATGVFISKMSDFIIRNSDPANPETHRDIDDSETKVELNGKKALEAAKYIRGERRSPN